MGEAPPVDGADVGCGTAVGEDVLLLATGVAVADDPQANSSATNNKTIALGQCFMVCLPNLDSAMFLLPLLCVRLAKSILESINDSLK